MRKGFPLLLLCALFLLVALASGASPPYLRKEVILVLDGEETSLDLRIETSHAMRADRMGGYLKCYETLRESYDGKDAMNYLALGLGDRLSTLCKRKKADPLDATLEWTGRLDSPFLYYEEKLGREVDYDELAREIAHAIDTGSRAYAHTRETYPETRISDLRERTREVSRFFTEFRTSGEARRHNIDLAAKAIGGAVIGAGEGFSFNAAVGERSAERGYRTANIVVNGEYVKGIGGGVCQVSTTLYNAVLLAGLPIESAAAHSRPVSYVPCSRDCTVSSAIDFRFRNDTESPLYVAAEITGSRLTFVLYGERKEGERRLESETVERIPFRALLESGATADTETDILLSPGHEGIRSRLYLTEIKNGVTTRTLIRENLYPAKDALYKKSSDLSSSELLYDISVKEVSGGRRAAPSRGRRRCPTRRSRS